MNKQFPRTEVGGVSLPRMLIGTNWLLGFSHTSAAADKIITDKFADPDRCVPIFKAYLDYGIDAVMGPISTHQHCLEIIRYAEEKLNHKFILIDTPGMNVDDSADARREAEDTIKRSADIGSTFCLIHHGSMEQLVNKNLHSITRLPDYLAMMRDHGLHPGLSAHMPEAIVYSDANGYDVETYIQIFNCMGFLMQVEVEGVYNIIKNAKKPVMTIKPFAAGRTTPFIGLNFNWSVLREQDMITVGVMSEAEVFEDVEISLAALERRAPELAGRSSPFKQDVLGH